MPRELAPSHDLDVLELAPGGSGVAHVTHEGQRRAVFLPRVAIGDRVRASVDFSTRPARATALALLSASPDRRAPGALPCRHLETCGACDFMHLSPEAQAAAHRAFVRAQLPESTRADLPIDTVAPARTTRYRARARVHVLTRGAHVTCGMFAPGTRVPVAVDECVVLVEALDRVRLALPELLQGARGEGEAHLALGRDATGREAAVVYLDWRGDPLPGAIFAKLERAVSAGQLAGVAIATPGARAPALLGSPAPVIRGADGQDLLLPVAGFAQAHGEANDALATAVAHEARALLAEQDPAGDGRGVVELYAGSGNLTVLLAAFARGLSAVESHGAACDALRENLRRRALSARVVHADAGQHLWAPGTRVAVLDPPRTGARAAAESLSASKVGGVVLVSCDPPTLGRDLALLERQYEITRVTTFEMFPETSHVETLVVLRRRRR